MSDYKEWLESLKDGGEFVAKRAGDVDPSYPDAWVVMRGGYCICTAHGAGLLDEDEVENARFLTAILNYVRSLPLETLEAVVKLLPTP